MWSLLRPQKNTTSPDHTQAPASDVFKGLFEQLLALITDVTAKTAFTKQFALLQTTANWHHAPELAAIFESVISYLMENQPPAIKTVVTPDDIQQLITQHLDPTQLDPVLMAALTTGTLQLAGLLGIGTERLAQVYYSNLSSQAARESLDFLIAHLPYQIPPTLYAELATDPPTFTPLLKHLAALGESDLLVNMHFMYQYFIDSLVKNNQQPQARQAMQEVYSFISQTYPQELTIRFLDLIPPGWLEQERGNLLGREELLKVLGQLQLEKAKLEAVNIRDEALLASIGDGVVAVDPNGKVIFINDSALQLLGMQSQEVSQINWFEQVSLLDTNDQPVPRDQDPMIQAMKTQQRLVSNELSFVRRDKLKLAAAITTTPYVTNGQVTGAILVFKDMTHEREVNRQKTEFISVASHQLRTPLGSMKLNLEMLSKNYHGELPPAAADVIKQTLEVNEHTLKLVNSLLDISRIESGRIQDHPSEVKLSEVLATTMSELEPLIQEKKVEVVQNLSSDLPLITLDQARLREIFENLISNAIKYSTAGGKVEVKMYATADSIMIEISDQGIGIPQKEQFKVFSRFFRAENALNQEPNGSGFGLFVVKSYIEGWGGKIWFKSPTTPDQKGTTFYVQIPLVVEVPSNGLYMDQRQTSSTLALNQEEKTL